MPNSQPLRLDSVRVKWEADIECPYPASRCQAIAVVSYEIGPSGDRRLETLSSGGLNAIEKNPTADYRHEVENEQLSELRDHLRVFGVPVKNFAVLAERPELQE